MSTRALNLFSDLPNPAQGEVFDELLRRAPVRIERIVSGPASASTLYDQVHDEWVLVLQGEARLWVAGAEIGLAAGDSLWIPARTPHRVLWTSMRPLCVWLAVYIEQEPPRAPVLGTPSRDEAIR